MTDYYSALREPISEACFTEHKGTVLGIYEPSSLVVNFHPSIESFIRTASECMLNPSTSNNITTVKQLGHYSTYIHETMHWWQFIASTAGFIQTLACSSQSLMTAINIQRMNNDFILCKPLIEQARSDKSTNPKGDWAILHTLVNSWFDVEYGICCMNSPEKLAKFCADGFFESVGICLYTLYQNALQAFHNQFPQTRALLPINDWESKFIHLRDSQYPNFHYKSEVILPKIGALAIFEGQARFTQLQFLHYALDGNTRLKDWKSQLHGIYVQAFQYFINILGVKWPEKANDPLINIFLLLCDIALNPSCGFPDGIETFEGFFEEVHPGYRFQSLCKIVAESSQFITQCSGVSRDIYLEISGLLCKSLNWKTPLDVVKCWIQIYFQTDLLRKLEELRTNHEFICDQMGTSMSMPIRLATARQVSLLQDKLNAPELFCWAGHYLGKNVLENFASDTFQLINKHPAPFAILNEYQDGPIVYMCGSDTIPPDDLKNENVVGQHFGVQTAADILRQTVSGHGQYSFNYLWNNPHINVDWKAISHRYFKSLTGKDLESIIIL